ncbi:MAG: hypothetical protein IJB83_05445 [Bacilli bacterium]|nr:hypothetical protein [Bacilli bacterium]
MKNRDMFYENYAAGGYNMPFNQNIPNMNMPLNYNIPNNYAPQYNNPNIIDEQMQGYNYDNNYEQRITRLEKIVRSLDTRVQKLEGSLETEDNVYMI